MYVHVHVAIGWSTVWVTNGEHIVYRGDFFFTLQIVTAGKNSLNNRFLPFSNIETEAIMTVDDDQKIPHGEIELGFRYVHVCLCTYVYRREC